MLYYFIIQSKTIKGKVLVLPRSSFRVLCYDVAEELFKEGKTIKEISEITGIGPGYISVALCSRGYDTKQNIRRRKGLLEDDVIDSFFELDSVSLVAKKFNISKATVYSILRDNNLKTEKQYNAVTRRKKIKEFMDRGCKMKVHKKEIKVGDFVETTVVHKSLSHNRMVSFGQLARGWVTDIEDNSVRIELMQKYFNGCAIAARKTDVTFIDRRKKEERKKTKLEEIVDSAVPKFNKDDYVEGIETVGVKGFDERTAFVRGWVNSVYGDYIDIQADDEYNGYRGTHIDFSTAKKIEPAKPRIVLL